MTYTLITGAAGFVGINLSRRLLEEGKHIIALDNHITSPQQNSNICKNNPGYQFIFQDINKNIPEKLLPKTISIDTIYHLACPTGVPNVITLAEEMALTCSLGTRNVLELAKKYTAEVIFTSSSEIYGNPEIFPQTEEYNGNVSPTGIRSPYEEGKRFSETLITLYGRKYHIPAKIIRVFNTYGPFMSEKDTRVIPHFIQQLKKKKSLTIYGDGKNKRTFCFIDDLISGMLTVKNKGENGEVYNIGSDEEITINDLAKKLITICKSNTTVIHKIFTIEDHTRRLPSLKKIEKLGWKRKISLYEGLTRTLLWYGL